MPPDAQNRPSRPLLRLAFGVLAVCAAIPLLAVSLAGDASVWSVAYLVGFVSVAAGCFLHRRRVRLAMPIGAAVLVLTPVARAASLSDLSEAGVRPADARFVNALYPEADGAIGAAQLMQWMGLHLAHGGDPPLADVLRDAYDRMHADLGDPATPAIATYLGLQRPEAFDTVRFDAPNADAAVIFLHGFSGNFNVYCWQFAQAARPAGMTTVCPSMGPTAQWWTEPGLRTVRATLGALRSEGFERIYLAGLSNGASGAAALAVALADELAGVVLISGGRTDVSAPTGLPVLAVTGNADAMIPAAVAAKYVAVAPETARVVQVPGGHFVFLTRHEEVGRIVTEWLANRSQGNSPKSVGR